MAVVREAADDVEVVVWEEETFEIDGDGFDQTQTNNAVPQIHHTSNNDNLFGRNYMTLHPPASTVGRG